MADVSSATAPPGGIALLREAVQHDLPRPRPPRLPDIRAAADPHLHQRSGGDPVRRTCLRIVAAGFLFYGYGMVLTQAFNGAGDTRTPTLIHVACFWMLEIPLASVLAYPAGLGPTGVFTAVSVGFSSLAPVSAILFRRGTWKTKTV